MAECVWAHYLSVTEKGRDGVSSLSAAQQQEVWVQYSALQTALQVWSYGQCFSVTDNKKIIHRFTSGLSSESKDPPERHVALRILSHTPVPHSFLSGERNATILTLFSCFSIHFIIICPCIIFR